MNRHTSALTGLRFLAAFLVVLHHFGKIQSPWLLHNVILHGYVAVSLFFILSGFILTYSYSDGKGGLNANIWNFLVARFARIYPVYLLAFLIYTPFALEEVALIRGATFWTDAGIAGAALALVQSWSMATVLIWNPPAWSLSAEAFFYLLFPLLAPAITRLTRRQLALAALVLWLLSLAGPAASFADASADRNFWMFDPMVRLPEFLLGVVLGRYWLMGRHAWFDKHAPVIALASAALLLAVLALDLPERILTGGPTAPLMMVLIFSLASGRGALAQFLASQPMIMLGEASYSLYILHWPLWFALTAFLLHLGHLGHGPGHVLLCMGLIVGASLLCFRFVEQPANRSLRKALWHRDAHAPVMSSNPA